MSPDYKTVVNVGKLKFLSELKKGTGTLIANDFLKKMVEEFGKSAAKFIDFNGYPAFAHSERQLHSILAPAFSKMTDTFLMEVPVRRDWSKHEEQGENKVGWIDYCCEYRNIAFLIELKHDFISYNSGKITSKLKSKWIEADKQIKVVEKEAEKKSEWSKGVFRVSLTIAPYVVKADEENKVVWDDLHKLIREELNPKPNWIGFWKLHSGLDYEFGANDNRLPIVAFIANVSEVTVKAKKRKSTDSK